MTFPVRESTATTAANPNTILSVTMPAGVVSGNLLLMYVASFAGRTPTTPTGWTLEAGAGSRYGSVFSRVSDGGEGASEDIEFTEFSICVAIAERWSGASGNVEAAVGTADADDPPNLTPSWGSKDTAWTTAFTSVDTTPPATMPANYGNQVSIAGTLDTCLSVGRRELAATSDNPAAWTGYDTAHLTFTVAIEPAAAAGSAVGTVFRSPVIRAARNVGRAVGACAIAVPTLHQVLHYAKVG